MSGRAIILLVVGIIMIAGTILYRIEAASTRIVANSTGYHKKQLARNIAQSGVNLALRQLESSSGWRTGFPSLNMLSGNASVKLFDTTFAGIPTAIGVRSTGTVQESSSVSTAFCYFPVTFIPPSVKGLLTLRSRNDMNGGMTLDGRDHDTYSSVVNAGKGTYGVWSTADQFNLGSSGATIGGTALGIDFAPANPANPAAVLLNQVYLPNFPNTPDSAIGGPGMGYPEGRLKTIAQSGVAGSQYVTDPSRLKFPLGGVTYVETPASFPVWNAAGIRGSGILVVHNSSTSAVLKGAQGAFAGVIVADDVTNFHASMWGAMVVLTTSPQGSILGNGQATVNYSRKAVLNAIGMYVNGTGLKVIAWRE